MSFSNSTEYWDLRETLEETGINFAYNDFKFIKRNFFSRFFRDIYETVWNGKAEDIKFDPVEVEDVKWVSPSEIIDMHNKKIFIDYGSEYFNNILGI